MLRFGGLALAAIGLSFVLILAYFYFCYDPADLRLTFFYVTGEVGSMLRETNLFRIVLPALAISTSLSAIFSLAFALFYSHRIAGPLFNLKRVIRLVRSGKIPDEVRIRQGDEFKDLADELNRTLRWLKPRLRGDAARRGK